MNAPGIMQPEGAPPHASLPHAAEGKYVSATTGTARTMPCIDRGSSILTHHNHVIVWIDHTEARIFGIGREDSDLRVVGTHAQQRHLHHKANSIDSGHAPLDKEYFGRVAESLKDAGALLITGPASAKTELAKYLREHHPQIAAHISAVEALDHPSDGMLIALARKFFRAEDGLRG
jgi:stalled ribosome rescue protein Dom34